MIGLLATAGTVGCRRHHDRTGGAVQTQTIAPAAAQPAPNDAMTQTVDVEEDNRSEEDGGVITQHAQGTTTAVTATATKKTAPKPKAKKSK
jgi:hypothetical protein